MTPRKVARSERNRGLKTSKPRFRRRLAAAICSCLGLVRAQCQAGATGWNPVTKSHPGVVVNAVASNGIIGTCCGPFILHTRYPRHSPHFQFAPAPGQRNTPTNFTDFLPRKSTEYS